MTFNEQIEGVPMELVKQGWRRELTFDDDQKWREKSPVNHWAYDLCGDNDVHFWIARPTILVKGFQAYAHAGWGGGLSPTPEMVKVWPFWWYRAASECQPHVVEVFHDEVLKLVSDRMHERPIARARGEWLGPVLPPVTP